MPQALLKTSPKNRNPQAATTKNNPQPRFKNRPIGLENRSPGNTDESFPQVPFNYQRSKARFPFKRTQRTQMTQGYVRKIRKQNKKCARNTINAGKLHKQKKQKYASASRATDASGHCVRNRNDRTDSIFENLYSP